jgi:hypothetical protein
VSSEAGEVRSRLARLDGLPAPDLWADIEARALGRLVEVPERKRRRPRRVVALVAAAAAVAAAFVGGAWIGRVETDRGRVAVAAGGSPVDRPWSQVAAFAAEPDMPAAAWLVARDDAIVVAAFANDRRIRLFDAGDPTAPPRVISTPPVAAVATSDGVPLVLAQDGRLLVIDHNAAREVAKLDPVRGPADLAVANGRVWIARGGSAPLTVVDLGNGHAEQIDAIRGVDVVRGYAGHVWAASRSGRRLVLLDALNRRVLAQQELGGVVAIAPGTNGDAWVLRSSGAAGEVLHLDADMRVARSDSVQSTTSDIAVGDGLLWTLDRGRLARTAIGEHTPAQSIAIGATVGRLALVRDALYAFGSDVRVFRPGGGG